MASKKKSEIHHAKRRALERYGLALTTRDLEVISKHCQSAVLSVVVERQSLRVIQKFVYFKGIWYPVIYDKVRKTVVTFMMESSISPEDWMKLNNHKNDYCVSEAIQKYEMKPIQRKPTSVHMHHRIKPPKPVVPLKVSRFPGAFDSLPDTIGRPSVDEFYQKYFGEDLK